MLGLWAFAMSWRACMASCAMALVALPGRSVRGACQVDVGGVTGLFTGHVRSV